MWKYSLKQSLYTLSSSYDVPVDVILFLYQMFFGEKLIIVIQSNTKAYS